MRMATMKMDQNLKKLEQFFKFFPCFLENRQKLIMGCSPFQRIIQFLSLDVLGAFHVRENVFKLDFTTPQPSHSN